MDNLVKALVAPFLDNSSEIEISNAEKFAGDTNSGNSTPDWKLKNSAMANKIGYTVVDPEYKNDGCVSGHCPEASDDVSIELSDDDAFMDVNGMFCEQFSYRLKIKKLLSESSKKKL